MRSRRFLLGVLLVGALSAALLLWHMVRLAGAMPVVRETTVAVRYPAGIARQPIRVALISDTHMSGPDMPPERMRRIVAAVNARRPDLVLLAGDYLGNDKPLGQRFSPAESTAPFAGFRAPLGVLAVLGNHDYWDGSARAVRAGLERAGVTVLVNRAVRRGPLAIGGVDDVIHGTPRPGETTAAVHRLGGVPVLLAHEPDIFELRPEFRPLMLAGHTHCGQVSLPLIGPLWLPSKVGRRFTCGRYDQPERTLIVTGGVGTSGLPIRLGAPPEFWIVTIVPK